MRPRKVRTEQKNVRKPVCSLLFKIRAENTGSILFGQQRIWSGDQQFAGGNPASLATSAADLFRPHLTQTTRTRRLLNDGSFQ
jgi:hypothetical protein